MTHSRRHSPYPHRNHITGRAPWPGRWWPILPIGPLGLIPPLASILAGCVRPDIPRPERLERGCIFMLPGIEGTTWQLRGTVKGLREAGIDQAIEPIAWGKHPFRQLRNLCALDENRKIAKGMAQRIAAYHAAHPDAPISLVGYSGGGGIAALVAENLPDDVVFDCIVLIAAALSPRYDLAHVFPHARRGVVNFYSRRDWLILGCGTRVFGTVDRQRTSSAGRVGFRDAAGRVIQSGQLTQISWRPDWVRLGHSGTHVGWLSTRWARDILAPQLDPSPTEPPSPKASTAP
jgi:pimeloyl-ACP methyl ester carboxylesterase